MAHHILSCSSTSVAVVTGGESGIGRASAIKLGKAGIPVVLTNFSDAAAADGTVAAIVGGGSRAKAVRADVGEETAVEALFDRAERRFGTVDLLVNSAGLSMSGVKLPDMELAQFDRLMRTDPYGLSLKCRRMVRALNAARRPPQFPSASTMNTIGLPRDIGSQPADRAARTHRAIVASSS